MSDSVIWWTAACQAFLTFTVSQSLLKLMSTETVMLSSHLVLCGCLLLQPSIFPSIRVFSNESALATTFPGGQCIFSFSISPSNEYSGLTSFRSDSFDLLAGQRSQESSSVPQFKSINSLVLSILYGTMLSLYSHNQGLSVISNISYENFSFT